MIEDRTKMLIDTVRKLYHREATHNIQKIFVKTHPADIAAVLEAFDHKDCLDLFRLEPSLEKRADVFSHLNQDLQHQMVQSLNRNEVTELVSLMESDDAADLLGDLPDETSQEILASVKRTTSEEVTGLLSYPEDSAGGLMSTSYLGLNRELSVEQAIQTIQSEENENAIPFYIYAVDDSNKLVGVVSLKQLLLSRKTDRLEELMYTEVVAVTVDTDQEDVARMVERYDYLALPVVDSNYNLLGVITVDDVIDVIREEAEEELMAMGQVGWDWDVSFREHIRARWPWQALACLGGMIAFAVVYFFGRSYLDGGNVGTLWLVAAFIPLLLALGSTIGSQTATVTLGGIRAGKIRWGHSWNYFGQELLLAGSFAIFFGLAVYLFAEFLFSGYQISALSGLIMALQVFAVVVLGHFVPLGIHRLGIDPMMASVPLFTVLANLTAMTILFGTLSL